MYFDAVKLRKGIKMSNDFVDDLTAAKKLKNEAHDELLKHVFDNVRNLTLCIWLILAGGAVIKYNAVLSFSPLTNLIFGCAIILIALGLGVWNMAHGVEKIIRPVVGTRKALIYIPASMAYFLLVLTIIQALIQLIAEKQLH